MAALFTAPVRFAEAVRSRELKRILPMELSSAEYQRLLGSDLAERSVFGARIANADFLQRLDSLIAQIVGGAGPEDEARRAAGEGPLLMDIPAARLQLKDYLQSIGYTPEKGAQGTLQDLSSDRRLDLLLETNTQMAYGFGRQQAGNTPETLDAYPAQELIRLEARNEPRNWGQRWTQSAHRAGDKPALRVYGQTQRMVALKDSPVWRELGNPEWFKDGIPNGYPPFAFGSGMDVADVSREDAEALGLLHPDDPTPKPDDRGFNDDLAVQGARFSSALQAALAREPGMKLVAGVLKAA
jgi:hypothetical protein